MTTTVGTEDTVTELVTNLLHLEHDAIAAYDSTIERLTDAESRRQIEAFRRDHEGHVRTLEGFAAQLGVEAPTGGDMKQMLTTGKVAIAGLGGDDAVLKAMKTNEDDTVQAYEQASSNAEADQEMRTAFPARWRTSAGTAPGWRRRRKAETPVASSSGPVFVGGAVRMLGTRRGFILRFWSERRRRRGEAPPLPSRFSGASAPHPRRPAGIILRRRDPAALTPAMRLCSSAT